jgi:hypothetical protein
MVQHCYSTIDVVFNKEVSLKHLTPEDISANLHDHRQYRLLR